MARSGSIHIEITGPDSDELERLRAWKAEAMEVLGQWEQVWEAAGRPGPLGGSKAEAVHQLLVRHGIRDTGDDRL